jgi:L-arabinose transport system permease protein
VNATLNNTETPAAPSLQSRDLLRRLIGGLGTHNLSLLIALACLVAIFGGLRPDVFFSGRNIENIGQGMAILGILASAQTIVIVSGGLDISVGAVVGLSTVCIALGVQQTGSPTLGILFGLVVGGLAGVVNGLIVTVGGVNAVIATLGTMAAFRGVAFIISDGQSISIFHPLFRLIGSGRWTPDYDRNPDCGCGDLLRSDALHHHRPEYLCDWRQSNRGAARWAQ